MPKTKIKNQIISITGATATGKSKLALDVAEFLIKNNQAQRVYLLSVDSRQVYQGLEILTAADLPHGWRLVKKKPYRHLAHPKLAITLHGISIVPIWQDWSPAHFQKLYKNIKNQLTNEDVLILVGGTGFYHRQIIQPAATLSIPPNPALRQELNKKSVQFLQEKLRQTDPEKLDTMNQSDIQNPRRLIRAIEIAQSNDLKKSNEKKNKEDIYLIHLNLNQREREENIKRRVAERFKHAVHEVRACLKQFKLSSELPAASSIGFTQIAAYLNHELNNQEALAEWQRSEVQYARRQDTWWKKTVGLNFLEANDPKLLTKTLALVL
jgi:tRNA dimethylallyltransferase